MARASWTFPAFERFSAYRNKMWYLLTTAVLFFLLTPGVLISLPPGSSFQVQAATHAVVFALVHKFVQHGVLKQ